MGISNVAVSLIVYNVMLLLNLYFQAANVIAFLAGTLNAYILNKTWVFKNRNGRASIKKEGVSFFALYFITWLIGAVLLEIWVKIFYINEKLAPIINIFIIMPINYIVSKYKVFNK